MSTTLSRLGWVFALSLTAPGMSLAQQGGGANHAGANDERPVKPTGPAAKKADDLIHAYTGRIEKEIEQGHKEVERLRSELHELIDVRDAMAEAIAELRGELATNGTYSADPVVPAQATQKTATPTQGAGTGMGMGMQFRQDFVYGLGSALPKEPTKEQREQLRRLAPRADLKRMIERLRAEVDETRTEVDELAYKLLELKEGMPVSFRGMGGMGAGMGSGTMGWGGGGHGQWFGSMGMPRGGMGGMGAGMR